MSRWFAVMAVAGVVMAGGVWAAEAAKKEGAGVLNHKMKTLAGKEISLSQYQGKVILVVNVASRCGYTPQYTGLQALHDKYAKEGLVVLGVPCNQFGAQEPGTSQEIAEFCQGKYSVTFDMLDKVEVNGDGACSFYKELTAVDAKPKGSGPVKWNFEKFLIGRDGQVIGRYPSSVGPNDDTLVTAIEAALKK